MPNFFFIYLFHSLLRFYQKPESCPSEKEGLCVVLEHKVCNGVAKNLCERDIHSSWFSHFVSTHSISSDVLSVHEFEKQVKQGTTGRKRNDVKNWRREGENLIPLLLLTPLFLLLIHPPNYMDSLHSSRPTRRHLHFVYVYIFQGNFLGLLLTTHTGIHSLIHGNVVLVCSRSDDERLGIRGRRGGEEEEKEMDCPEQRVRRELSRIG